MTTTTTDDTLPEPPSWLPPVAAARFHEVVGFLRSTRTLAGVDISAVTRLAVEWARWVEASRKLASGEESEFTTSGGRYGDRVVPSPARRAASEASKELSRLERALGLDPAARSALKMAAAVDSEDMEWAALVAASMTAPLPTTKR
jgi:P27 family predicted phage terminase small subunit